MDNGYLPNSIYSPSQTYGSSVDAVLEEIVVYRKHPSGCESIDGVTSTTGTGCIDCPYNPYRDSVHPCKDVYTLHGFNILDNKIFSLEIPGESSHKVEAIYRVLEALGGLKSRSVKISIKSFTEVEFSINKVIPQSEVSENANANANANANKKKER